jgi:acyl dehydratase
LSPVSKLHFEDFTPGRVFEHGPRRVPRDEMIAFAAEFDPQPMHLDEAAAKQTMMGGLSASGWYACCILMRMSADSFVVNSSSMGAPGVDEVRWLAPIRPDDELRLRATVAETRVSKSRPDMGFVRFDFEIFNAGGVRVMTLTTSLMMGRRNVGAPS